MFALSVCIMSTSNDTSAKAPSNGADDLCLTELSKGLDDAETATQDENNAATANVSQSSTLSYLPEGAEAAIQLEIVPRHRTAR